MSDQHITYDLKGVFNIRTGSTKEFVSTKSRLMDKARILLFSLEMGKLLCTVGGVLL